MKKAAVVAQIAKRTGLCQREVKLTLEVFFQTIQEEIARGEEVHFRGFGHFLAKKRKQRIARNITQNTAIVLPEHYTPSFIPAQSFIDKVRDSLGTPPQNSI